MRSVIGVVTLAFALAACSESPTAPPLPKQMAAAVSQHDVSGNPNASATMIRSVACVQNPLTCNTQFGSWMLTTNWTDAWFTNNYDGPGGDHVFIKAIWISPNVYQVIDEKGKIDGVKLDQLVTPPHGLGQALKP